MHQNLYLVNYPKMPENFFYTDCEGNGGSKPFNELIKGVLNSQYNCMLCQSGWKGEKISDVAAIVLFNSELNEELLSNLSRIPKHKCFLVLLEPPNMDCFIPHYHPKMKDYFGTIFTLMEDLVDHQTYLKLIHWQARDAVVKDPPSFKEKKICTMIQSNRSFDHPDSLFEERNTIAHYLSRDPEFDLFGSRWDHYKSYRGFAGNKLDTMKGYKFVVAYENTRNRKGFITERIIEALYAQCVPIYWGAPDIASYIPQNCFIHRPDFSSNDALYTFLKEMDETTHESYLRAGQEFLQSPFAKEHFSVDSFARSILRVVTERAHLDPFTWDSDSPMYCTSVIL